MRLILESWLKFGSDIYEKYPPQKLTLHRKTKCLSINSLWGSDAIRWHRAGSILLQVMAWCWQATSHYLNQCWSFTNIALCQSHQRSLTNCVQDINPWNEFEICTFKIAVATPRGQWVNYSWARIKHMVALWHHTASAIMVIIVSGNDGLSPGRRKQCWLIICWILGNKFQRNLIKIHKIVFNKNAFENVVCKMATLDLKVLMITAENSYQNYV